DEFAELPPDEVAELRAAPAVERADTPLDGTGAPGTMARLDAAADALAGRLAVRPDVVAGWDAAQLDGARARGEAYLRMVGEDVGATVGGMPDLASRSRDH